MNDRSDTKITSLGQVGLLIQTFKSILLIDPYLSNSVAEQFGGHLSRQVQAVVQPEELTEVDHVLLTHAHLDHTDPSTLKPLASASPQARFTAPYESRTILRELGISDERMDGPPEEWISICEDVEIRAVPAAHTQLERNPDGELCCVGYLLRIGGKTLYHAGDTIPHEEVFTALAGEAIDIAFLPVNERNYYRDRNGIIGNMTLREAFQMAADIECRTLVPTHWDLFAPNRVHRREIELFFELEHPRFELRILDCGETISFA